MRQHKFRGKRKDNGEWIYGNLALDWSGGASIIALFGPDCTGCSDCGSNKAESYEVDIETVGEYAGLPDKNDKDIYDGDVLDGCYTNPLTGRKVVQFYLVAFEKGAFRVKLIGHSPYGDTLLYFQNDKCVVAGNIYDNPELVQEAGK